MSRRRWGLVGGVAVVAATLGWFAVPAVLDRGDAPVGTVTRGRLEQTVETSGAIEAARPVVVGGRVSARLVLLAVLPGDRVAIGDIVALLDPGPYEATMAAAARAVAAAELALTAAEATPRAAGSIAGLAAGQRVAEAKAARQAAQRDLEAATVLSPVAGTVLSVEATEGQAYAAAAPLITIAADDRLRIAIELDEIDAARLSPGTDVTIVLAAFPAEELDGVVTTIAPAGVERAGGTVFTATAEIGDFRGVTVKPGMTATVRIPSVAVDGALLVPSAAISTVGERSFVDVVRGERSVRVEVMPGLRDGGVVEIVAGDLREGERVRLGG